VSLWAFFARPDPGAFDQARDDRARGHAVQAFIDHALGLAAAGTATMSARAADLRLLAPLLTVAVVSAVPPRRDRLQPSQPRQRRSPSVVTDREGLQQVVDEALQANLQLRASGASDAAAARGAGAGACTLPAAPSISPPATLCRDGGRTLEIPVATCSTRSMRRWNQMLVALRPATAVPARQQQTIRILCATGAETKICCSSRSTSPHRPGRRRQSAQVTRAEADLAALRSH